MEKPTVWKMVKEAVENLSGKASYSQIKNYINRKWEDVNSGTITDQIQVLTVNHPSRIHYPENHKPRSTNSGSQYDILFTTARGQVELYNPEKHNIWEIYKDESGKWGIRLFKEPKTLGPSDIMWIKGVTNEINREAYLNVTGNTFHLHVPNKHKTSAKAPAIGEIILIYQNVDGIHAFTHLVTPVDDEVREDKTRQDYRYYREVKIVAKTGRNNYIPQSSTLWSNLNIGMLVRGNVCKIDNKITGNNINELRADIWLRFRGHFTQEQHKSTKSIPQVAQKPSTTTPSYYLIGSKYAEHNDLDIFPLMEENNVVCTGFAWDYDLSHLYLAKNDEIIEKLSKQKEPPKSYNALKLFLQLKPGDIVAIKSAGTPRGGSAFIEIIAYAVVVEREGVTYWHEPNELGHCINVQYITTGIKKQHKIGGYGRTVHHVTDNKLINLFFGDYKNSGSDVVRERIRKKRRTRKAAAEKSTKSQRRKGSAGYITNPKHNLIQQRFKEYLETNYGPENVLIEENNVDVKLYQEDCITFYEVKPYDFAEDCIRDGLGQLLSYVFFDKDPRQKNLKIVGPYPPVEEEKVFINFLKSTMSISFDYEYFNMNEL
jgi:hypothetical protein